MKILLAVPALAALLGAGTPFFAHPPQDSAPTEVIERADHVVTVGGQSIHIREVFDGHRLKRAATPDPAVIFLHGGTWSGKPNFDLPFEDYSVMEQFARRGWDTFAVDFQGYGSSSNPKEGSWCEATDAVLDLKVAVDHVLALRKTERVHLIGWSWGSQVAALFAQTYPDLTGRVVLYGTRWAALVDAPALPEERFRENTLEDARSDFVEGCFDPDLVEAYAKAAVAADPDTPNGVFRDYFGSLPIIDPETLRAPTLLISGEHEAAYAMEDLVALFQALASSDKQLAVIPGGGHAVHLEKGRFRWYETVHAFLQP